MKKNIQNIRLTKWAGITLVVIILAHGIALAGGNKNGNGQPPSHKVALLALKSEKASARADYRLALAKAHNLTERQERKQAKHQAFDDFWVELDAVRARYVARIDLADSLGERRYDPDLSPDNFMSPAEIAANPNPYWPLVPGTIFLYEGDTDEGLETVRVHVTHETREIEGVECIVVRDTVEVDGEVVEDTRDWYAQDKNGNVWYFGELSVELENGEIFALTGSWETGVDGALPGIIMFANPQIGQIYRQEFYLLEAEDAAEILSLTASTSVPYGTYNGICLQTAEFLPTDPDVLEHKFYAPGIGFVLEVNPDSGERVELVDIQTE